MESGHLAIRHAGKVYRHETSDVLIRKAWSSPQTSVMKCCWQRHQNCALQSARCHTGNMVHGSRAVNAVGPGSLLELLFVFQMDLVSVLKSRKNL